MKVLLLLIPFLFMACKKKEGCTDLDAIDYDAEAQIDDQSCSYKGSAVFWFNESTSNNLEGTGAVFLLYFRDENLLGSRSTNDYVANMPDCGDDKSFTINSSFGPEKSLERTYRVVDQDGSTRWTVTIGFIPNTCVSVPLVL